MLKANSASPKTRRSPWTRRVRLFFLPLTRISPCLSISSRLKSRPSKRIWACVSLSSRLGTATSLPKARPIVDTGFKRTKTRGEPSDGNHFRVGMEERFYEITPPRGSCADLVQPIARIDLAGDLAGMRKESQSPILGGITLTFEARSPVTSVRRVTRND